MRTTLTNHIVTKSKPKGSPYELRDTHIKGLLLRVQPSGHKSWVVEWARGRRRTLGAISELSLDAARAAAADVMADAFRTGGEPRIAKPKRASVTLGEFLDTHYGPWLANQIRWSDGSIKRIKYAFERLLSAPVASIDSWSLDRWWTERTSTISQRTGLPISKATASREMAALRSALEKAVDWGFADSNSAALTKLTTAQSKAVVRFLSAQEEQRLRTAALARDRRLIQGRLLANRRRAGAGAPMLSELPLTGFYDHLTPLVLLAMNTGLRKGELLALEWDDVALDRGVLTVRAASAKNGKARHVPLNSEALDVLQRWRRQQGAGGPRVFPVGDFKKGWQRLRDDAQIKDFRFHDLRHHFASALVMKGVDLNTVRELMGHADLSMTLRYAHLAPEHLAEAVGRLGSG